MKIEKIGLEELSLSERKNVNGGIEYKWYSGGNPLIYFGYAVYNGCVSVYKLFT